MPRSKTVLVEVVEVEAEDIEQPLDFGTETTIEPKEEALIEPKKRGRPKTRVIKYRRPPTQYNLFVQAVMPDITTEYPDMKPRERMQVCSMFWQLLNTQRL